MEATINPRIAVNLTPEDSELLDKAKAAFESRTGVSRLATTEAIRLAIKAFAREESV